MTFFKILITFIIGISIGTRNRIIGYSFIFLVFLFITKKDIFNDLKKFKKISKKDFLLIGIIFISSVILILLLNYILSTFFGEPSNNLNVKNYILSNPIYYFPIVNILVPFDEEIFFRYAFKFINNKYVFYVITSLIYAIFHINYLSEIIFVILYFILGLCFAYTYKKNNNIIWSIILHIIYNTLAFILLFI